ncbi:MAG TPA: autotransporter domain-containing protein [Rhizomicrobium sp.]|nr:autotransporter domain-containing protein [Rhizomicrobium sp.]
MFVRKSRSAVMTLTFVASVAGGIGITAALANTPIDTNQAFYLQSQVGVTVDPDFQGGTLRIDNNGVIDSNDYTVENIAGNTIDEFGNTITFTGTFSGAGALDITDSVGGGTMIVSNTNVIGGTVTIESGAMMQWGDGTSAGFLIGPGNSITDNGALVMDFGGSGIAGSVAISGSGTVELKSGSLNESGTATYTGTTTIDAAGDLQLSGGGSIASSSNLIDNGIFDISGTAAGTSIQTLSGSGSVKVGSKTLTLSNASGTFSGVIQDAGGFPGTGGGLTIAAGTETLTGANTFTGTTTIDPGATLQLGNGGTTGTLAGDITDNGLLRFIYGGPVTAPNAISGTGSVDVLTGTVILSNTSVVGGTVTIEPGATMQWGDGTSAGFLVGAGNSVDDHGALVMDFGGSGIAGSVAISGPGTVELKSGSLNESGVATYTGTTTIDAAGDLQLSGGGSIASSSNLIDNGIFDISGTAAGTSIQTLSGSGSVKVGSKTLTLSNASGTFSGVIQDAGGFPGTGGGLTIAAGTETLTGANTFTGTTTIDPGATLQLGDGTSANGSVAGDIVDNGALLFDYAGTQSAGGTISGTGSAEIVAGTTIVTKASVIGGTVTIDSGATLQWGDSNSAFLVGGGNAVVDNGALVMNFGGGGIAGAVPISGSGTVELVSGSINDSGVSTYTGATTIDSNGLFLMSGGGSIATSSGLLDDGVFDISGTAAGNTITSLTGSGGVSLGSKTLTLSNASGTFSGVLADGGFSGGTGGGLTLAAGTETLTGNNTYTGVTTIDPGATLQLGDGTSANGSVAGDIADNGALLFDYAGTQTAGGTISGTGSVEVIGGTVVETGADSLGGPVTIDSGATLQWGDGTGPAYMTGTGNAVVDNGALVLSFGGGGVGGTIPISGTGSVTLQSGSFNNAGVSTYTGATTIDSGALLLLTGSGSIADSSGVSDDGIFDISGTTAGASITGLTGSGSVSLGGQLLTLTNASGIFSGAINDGGLFGGTGGSLTVAAGTETLNGVNTFTGATTIDSGATLIVGDAGNPGAVLDSHVGGVLVNAGATLKGHGTINGAVADNGTVVAGGSIGTLTVGSYTQAANATLAIEVSPTQASQLKSLGAANLDGTLALTFDAGTYNAAIYQIVTGAPVSGTFSTVTASGSPDQVYALLYPSNHTEVDLVTESKANAQVYGGVSAATLDQAQSLVKTVEGRLNDCTDVGPDGSVSTCRSVGVWVKGLASSDHLDNRGGYFGLRNTTTGFVGGIDTSWADASSLGVAFSYSHDSLNMSAASAKASGPTYYAALYGRLVAGETWFDGQAFYLHNDWTVRRSLPGYGTASSSPGGDTEGALLQISTGIGIPDLRPYLQGAYAQFHRPAVVETGVGPLDYSVSSDNSNRGYVEAGLRFAHSYVLEDGDVIRPAVQFGLQGNFGDMKQAVTASLNGLAGTGFAINAARMDSMAGVVDASVVLALSSSFDLTGELQGRVGNGHTEGMALLGGAFKF